MAPPSTAASDAAPRNIATQSKPRKRKSTHDEDDAPSERPTKRFQQLKPRTKHISQKLITDKWKNLPANAQHQVRELFKSAKRPVVLSRRDERQRREAEAVLDYVVGKLERQLPRMPFPPKATDIHFNLDGLLERNRELEGQVTPALHAIGILEAEIEKEEASLELDREALRRLEKSAGAAQKEARKQAQKLHPLLEDTGGVEAKDTAELINLHVPQRRDSGLGEDDDPDLQHLLSQFRSHLESMRANTEQLHNLDRAVTMAEASLSSVMLQGSDHN